MGPSGYGEAGRRYLKALERTGIALTWSPLVPVTDRNKSYSSNQRWADPDVEHATALIRSVFENPAQAKVLAGRLQSELGQRFSEEAVARVLIDSVLPADPAAGRQSAIKRGHYLGQN